MKVKAIQFVPLGRPPKSGECYRWSKSESFHIAHDSAIGNPDAEAVKRREVEVDVPDPVPEWILKATAERDESGGWTADAALLDRLASAFRSHVEERAKAAAEKWYTPQFYNAESHNQERLERIIREEFLRP